MNAEQERAAFEAWYLENNDVPHEAIKRKGAGYAWIGTDEAWEIWQAAQAALQSQDREDAARYRWLRLQRSITDLACVTWNIGHDWVQMDGAELDEAIDHARRAEEDGE